MRRERQHRNVDAFEFRAKGDLFGQVARQEHAVHPGAAKPGQPAHDRAGVQDIDPLEQNVSAMPARGVQRARQDNDFDGTASHQTWRGDDSTAPRTELGTTHQPEAENRKFGASAAGGEQLIDQTSSAGSARYA